MVLAHILITLYVMVAPNVYAVDKRIRIPIASIEACRPWIEDEAKVVIEYAGDDMRAGFACVDEPTSKRLEPKRQPEMPV